MSNSNSTEAILAQWIALPYEGDRCPVHLIAEKLALSIEEVSRVLFSSYEASGSELKAKWSLWVEFSLSAEFPEHALSGAELTTNARALAGAVSTFWADLPEATRKSPAERSPSESFRIWAVAEAREVLAKCRIMGDFLSCVPLPFWEELAHRLGSSAYEGQAAFHQVQATFQRVLATYRGLIR